MIQIYISGGGIYHSAVRFRMLAIVLILFAHGMGLFSFQTYNNVVVDAKRMYSPGSASIPSIKVQNESLTITSFLYNPTSTPSEWIDRIFGSKSIFYPHRTLHKIISDIPLTKEETSLGINIAKKAFTFPTSAIWPGCSIELLGYGLLGVSNPFTEHSRQSGPSYGLAKLKLLLPTNTNKDIQVSCYYRGIYENWRQESAYTNPNYWAIVIYCPIQNSSICQKINDHEAKGNKLMSMQVSMTLESTTWTSQFFGSLRSNRRMTLPNTTETSNQTSVLPKLGICLAIPYTSNDPEKRVINRAILLDWVRYYLNLQYTVLIYDRDGSNYDNIFNNERHEIPDDILESNVVYHNYTIRGLLDIRKRGMQYDNSELKMMNSGKNPKSPEALDRRSRFESQGHDKTLTLTHCRFEAKALFGIDTVLVADFDEFLYCPVGSSNRTSQTHYMQLYFNYNRENGVDQITVPQRYITNKTISTRQCIKDKVAGKQTIFDCFAPYFYYMGGHSVKSVHLGHKCPLTGYHQACPMAEAPRSYDCLCVNKNLRHILPWRGITAPNEGRECGFVHVSVDDNNYVKFTYSEEDVSRFKKEDNEIGIIINSAN